MKGDIVGMANYEKQRLHTPPISLYNCYIHSQAPYYIVLHACARAKKAKKAGRTLSKMASFNVDSCRDQTFSLETWEWRRTIAWGTMHTSDHRRSVWYKN